MTTVAHTPRPTPPYVPRAMYATYLSNWGTALRTSEGRVFFQYAANGLWTELFDRDAPDVVLHGRLDLIAAAMVADALHQDLYQPRHARHRDRARQAA